MVFFAVQIFCHSGEYVLVVGLKVRLLRLPEERRARWSGLDAGSPQWPGNGISEEKGIRRMGPLLPFTDPLLSVVLLVHCLLS